MTSPTLGGMLLASTAPAKLRDWYASAFDVQPQRTPGGEPGYDVFDFGGFFIMIDTRDDIGEKNPEPGRVVLNFHVADAHATAGRIDKLGTSWLAPLEDRDGSLFGTAIDPDGNYVQIIQLSEQHRAEMASK